MSGLSLNYFLPYQQTWINESASLAIGEKSRRIGWTYASSYRGVERRLKLGTNLYFSSADLTAAREFVDYCNTWCRVFNAVAQDQGLQVIDEDSGVTAFVLKFDNGSKIYAGSSNPKFFRSKGGDADGDEYAFHKDQRELFKAMHATAMVWGYQLRLWSTHNGEGSFFNQMVMEGKKWMATPPEQKAAYPDLRATVQTVTILDAVKQGLVEKIKGLSEPNETARRDWLGELRSTVPDEDTWNEEYLCKPSSEQSSLLSYDLIRRCEREADELPVVESPADLRTNAPLYVGWDVGRKRDLSVFWVLARVADLYETRLIKRMRNETFRVQAEFFISLMLLPGVRRGCIDATGMGAPLAESMTQRFGHRVEAVTFSAPVKAELAMPLRGLFEDVRVRVPADPSIRESLHKVRKTVTAAGNVRFDAHRDDEGHADEFWALALAYHAADDLKQPLPPPRVQKPVGW